SNITEDCVFYITISDESGFTWHTQGNGYIKALTVVSKDANLVLPDDITSTTTPVGSVTFNTTDDVWSHTWSNLSLYNSDGKRLYYYVKEAEQGDYYASYSYEYNSDGSIKFVTVTNYDAPDAPDNDNTEITVKKEWKDADSQVVTKNSGSINFQLWRIEATSSVDNATVTISSNGNLSDSLTYPIGTVVTYQVSYSYYIWQQGDITVTQDSNALVASLVEVDYSGNYTAYYEFTFTVNANTSIYITLYDSTSSGWSADVKKDLKPSSSSTKTQTCIGTYTIAAPDWTCTISDLPTSGTDGSGNKVSYTYYVLETSSGNYTATYDNNAGITEGTITITNTLTDTPTYTMPETGGMGTTPYTYGGLLLTLSAAGLLVYRKKKRGKEVQSGPS
ncbi:MAG: Cna B-type domain-containing protein, partial [Lachnospiraceae bacterium]|nr:Cna B-type domain-containing protein [Lachnospiraceae bacterium]